MPRSFAARSSPFSIASFKLAAVPTMEMGASLSSSLISQDDASLAPFLRSSAVNGLARGGKSSSKGNSTGPSIAKRFSTSTCNVTLPETSMVWPAISPSPWAACISPR